MTSFGVELDEPLPARLHTGRGQTLLIRGTYDAGIASGPYIAIDGAEQSVVTAPDGSGRGRFWSLIEFPAAPSASAPAITIRAELADGSERSECLGEVSVLPGRPSAPEADPPIPARAPDRGRPFIAVCMTTYRPDLDLLRAQIDSLKAQTHHRWIALISDDGSPATARHALDDLIAGDTRFHVIRDHEHVGLIANFERALAAVPEWIDQVGFCDQDDRWHPDKLRRLSTTLLEGNTRLACCDARIVERDGTVRSDTFWTTRRRGAGDLRTLLSANWVSGAMTLFDAALLDTALPVPRGPAGLFFHDQWFACVAAVSGGVTFVPVALLDYVQHGANAFSHARTVAPSLSHLDPRGTLAGLLAGDGDDWFAPHIDAFMRARGLAKALAMREPTGVGSVDALMRSSPGRIFVGQGARALAARLRGGPAHAEAAVAWGALAARHAGSAARQTSGRRQRAT